MEVGIVPLKPGVVAFLMWSFHWKLADGPTVGYPVIFILYFPTYELSEVLIYTILDPESTSMKSGVSS